MIYMKYWRQAGWFVLDQEPAHGQSEEPVCGCGNLSGTMRGTARKISIPRRLVADLMHASIRIPFVSLQRPP